VADVTINMANENLMSSLAVFKFFHVCICSRFENTSNFYDLSDFYNSLIRRK
jgi:hypothetical protein